MYMNMWDCLVQEYPFTYIEYHRQNIQWFVRGVSIQILSVFIYFSIYDKWIFSYTTYKLEKLFTIDGIEWILSAVPYRNSQGGLKFP